METLSSLKPEDKILVNVQKSSGIGIDDPEELDQPLIVSCGDESTIVYWQVQSRRVMGTTEKQNASWFYLIPDREHPGVYSIGYTEYHRIFDMSYIKANLNLLGHNSGPLGLVSHDTHHRHTRLSLKLSTLYKGNVLYPNSYYIKCARRRERSGYIAMKLEKMNVYRSSKYRYVYITKCVHKLSENDKPDTWMQFYLEPAMESQDIGRMESLGAVRGTFGRVVSDSGSCDEID